MHVEGESMQGSHLCHLHLAGWKIKPLQRWRRHYCIELAKSRIISM